MGDRKRERDPEREKVQLKQFCSNEGRKEEEDRRSGKAVVVQVASINLYLQLGRNLYGAVQQRARPVAPGDGVRTRGPDTQ